MLFYWVKLSREKRFQLIQDKYGSNSRKFSSGSTLSDSTERDLSIIIIFLPTNNKHVCLRKV